MAESDGDVGSVAPAIADCLRGIDDVEIVTATLTVYTCINTNGARAWGIITAPGQDAIVSRSLSDLADRTTDGWMTDLVWGSEDE